VILRVYLLAAVCAFVPVFDLVDKLPLLLVLLGGLGCLFFAVLQSPHFLPEFLQLLALAGA